jgi:hypothetical protein
MTQLDNIRAMLTALGSGAEIMPLMDEARKTQEVQQA